MNTPVDDASLSLGCYGAFTVGSIRLAMTPNSPAKALVFVIDDEQVIARTLAIILQRAGYRTEFFNSAEQALAAASLRRPDLIVSDVVMSGMNGIELAAEVGRSYPNLPFILISGQAQTSQLIDEARARGQQVQVHPKPMMPEVLIREVGRLIAPTAASHEHDLAA